MIEVWRGMEHLGATHRDSWVQLSCIFGSPSTDSGHVSTAQLGLLANDRIDGTDVLKSNYTFFCFQETDHQTVLLLILHSIKYELL